MPTRKTNKTTSAKKTTPSKKTALARNSRSTKVAPARTSQVKSSPISSQMNFRNLIIPLLLLLIAVLIWFFRNQFIVATVNGQPITRFEVIKELEAKSGKTVLQSIITQDLILQEAKKRNISVTDSEVNSEISKIEKSISSQGQSLDSVLAQQGMTRADLNNQVKLQLLLKKMVATPVVTDKDVEDYMTQNKDSLPQSTDQAKLKDQVKNQLMQEKVSTSIQSFVGKLQSNAKIDYLRNY